MGGSGQAFKAPTNLTIVGLGGCGKRLTSEVCNQDWLLEHYTKGVNRLTVYTMDTDANEYEDDLRREEEVLRKVDDINGTGMIDFKAFYLPGLANVTQVSDLASQDIANRIKRSQSIKTWWLNDVENGGFNFDDLSKIDRFILDDFGGGVHRRRAISKAVLYKVLSEGQANGFPSFSTPGVTAIVVGIGGGTGSGMFIDVARYIKSKKDDPIYLFAVLPTTKEGEKEQLNAAIALTELEYLSVADDEKRLFEHVIFVSLGPTGYTNGQKDLKEVSEFDSVFPQIFTNYFNIEKGDLHITDARAPYSSFIFADAHVIEYPVQELRELKEQYGRVIEELEEVNLHRQGLNAIVEEMLNEFSQLKESTPTIEIFEYIKNQYENTYKVWSNNVPRFLGYHTVEIIDFFIENQMDTRFEKISRYEEMVTYLSRVKEFSHGISPDKLKDELDRKLYRLIPDTLETLGHTAKLFSRVAGIEDETIRSVIIDILKGKQKISSTEGELASLNQKVQEVETELEEEKTKLKNMDGVLVNVEKEVENKLNDVDLDIEHLSKINKLASDFPDLQGELKEILDEYIGRFKRGEVTADKKDSWKATADTEAVKIKVNDISQKIDIIKLDRLASFIDSITDYYYYLHKVRKEEDKGAAQRFIDKVKNTKGKIKQLRENKEKCEQTVRLSLQGFNVRIDNEFNITIYKDFLSEDLNSKIIEYKNKICKSMDLTLDSELDVMLESQDRAKIRKALKQYLKRTQLESEDYGKRVNEIEAHIEDLARALENKKLHSEMLAKVNSSNNKTFTNRRELNSHYDLFFKHFVEIEERNNTVEKTVRGLYRTKFGNINPRILSLIEPNPQSNKKSDLGNLDMNNEGKAELDNLVNIVESTYQKLFDVQKLGVSDLRISISTTERWNFGKGGLVISTSSPYVRSEIMAQRSRMQSTINHSLSMRGLDDSLLTTQQHTKPWEIALIFYAASSFFDNIHPLVTGGGYWDIYERNKNNILHHVLKLQEGEYIIRKSLMKPEEAGSLANLETKNASVTGDIQKLYLKKQLLEALDEN